MSKSVKNNENWAFKWNAQNYSTHQNFTMVVLFCYLNSYNRLFPLYCKKSNHIIKYANGFVTISRKLNKTHWINLLFIKRWCILMNSFILSTFFDDIQFLFVLEHASIKGICSYKWSNASFNFSKSHEYWCRIKKFTFILLHLADPSVPPGRCSYPLLKNKILIIALNIVNNSKIAWRIRNRLY